MNKLYLQNLIYDQNVEAGWWDEPRCFSKIINLCVSEGSEALEGDRRLLPDDHLKQYPMTVVEVADLAIRAFDYLGHVGNESFSDFTSSPFHRPGDFQFNLASIHWHLGKAWFEKEVLRCEWDMEIVHLRTVVELCYLFITDLGYDPTTIITEKVWYNRTRHDHQRENRLDGQPGSKRY